MPGTLVVGRAVVVLAEPAEWQENPFAWGKKKSTLPQSHAVLYLAEIDIVQILNFRSASSTINAWCNSFFEAKSIRISKKSGFVWLYLGCGLPECFPPSVKFKSPIPSQTWLIDLQYKIKFGLFPSILLHYICECYIEEIHVVCPVASRNPAWQHSEKHVSTIISSLTNAMKIGTVSYLS